MGKKGKKLIATGCTPPLRYCIDEGRFLLPKKCPVDNISISALGEVRHDMKSSKLNSHDNVILIEPQGSIIQATVLCSEVKSFSYEVSVLDNVPIGDTINAYD